MGAGRGIQVLRTSLPSATSLCFKMICIAFCLLHRSGTFTAKQETKYDWLNFVPHNFFMVLSISRENGENCDYLRMKFQPLVD